MRPSIFHRSVGAKIALATAGALGFVTTLFLLIFYLLDVPWLSKFTTIQFLIAFVVLLVFVEVILVMLAANLFVQRPLQKLSDVMRIAEEGNFKARVQLESTDELGELAGSFNSMMAKISALDARKIETEREYRISQSLANTLEVSELVHTISRSLTDTLHLKEFALLFFNREQVLEAACACGFKDDLKVRQTAFKQGEGPIGRAASLKKTIYTQDIHLPAGTFHSSSFVCIPLAVGDKVLGVLAVGDADGWTFSDNDIKFLESLANQIAIAYDRSMLYTKTKELSVTDELTGAYNRRHFHHTLHMEWKRASRFGRSLSLLMVDADHFKQFNDTFGHLRGDQVLKELAALLVKNIREVDMVARFGGEEFVIILADTSLDDAVMAAEKLRNLVEKNFREMEKEGPPVTVSIGVSAFPDLAVTEEELINTADIALYRAKAFGRNRVVKFERPFELKTEKSKVS